MEIKKDGGALFPNTYKQKPTHPDYTGSFTLSTGLLQDLLRIVEGEGGQADLRLAAWSRRSKGGKEYLSVSFGTPTLRETDAAPKQRATGVSRPSAGGDAEEDPPF